MAKLDIRDKLFKELQAKLKSAGIKAIIRENYPANGPTIKLNGVDLYKVLEVPNPFKTRGAAIYRRLNDDVIKKLGGKRSRSKNGWVCAPVTESNYALLLKVLLKCADVANAKRNKEMADKAKEEKNAA